MGQTRQASILVGDGKLMYMYQAKQAGRGLIRFYLGDGSGSDVPENVAPMPGL